MQNQRVGFFEEAPGHKSSMRLFSAVLLLFFCGFNFYYIRHHVLSDVLVVFDLVLLVGIYAPKYLQKVAEMRFGSTNAKRQPDDSTPIKDSL